MWQRECGSVRGTRSGLHISTGCENVITINEDLGIVLDEALVHASVHSVACPGPCQGAYSCSC